MLKWKAFSKRNILKQRIQMKKYTRGFLYNDQM